VNLDSEGKPQQGLGPPWAYFVCACPLWPTCPSAGAFIKIMETARLLPPLLFANLADYIQSCGWPHSEKAPAKSTLPPRAWSDGIVWTKDQGSVLDLGPVSASLRPLLLRPWRNTVFEAWSGLVVQEVCTIPFVALMASSEQVWRKLLCVIILVQVSLDITRRIARAVAVC